MVAHCERPGRLFVLPHFFRLLSESIRLSVRSTVCISCRCRKDRDHWDRSYALHALPVPLGHGLILVGSGHLGYLLTFYLLLDRDMEQQSDSILLDALRSSRRTSHNRSSCTLPADLSVRMPAGRYPDAAAPYRRYDPSTCGQ